MIIQIGITRVANKLDAVALLSFLAGVGFGAFAIFLIFSFSTCFLNF
jgi:hypothetical protein